MTDHPNPHVIGLGTLLIVLTVFVVMTLTLGLLLRLLKGADGL